MKPSALWLLFAVAAVGLDAAQTSGTAPRIEPRAVGCFVKDRFAEIATAIEPAEGLARVRLYFRSPRDPDFLFVEMTPSGKAFVGVLPRPKEDATPVTYFIEAASDGRVSRSPAMTAPVVASPRACGRGQPAPDAGRLADLPIYTLGTATTIPVGFSGVSVVRPAPRGVAASSAAASASSAPASPSPAGPGPVSPNPPNRTPAAPAPPPASAKSAPPTQAAVEAPIAPSASRSELPTPSTAVPEYALGKEDIVRVSVYGHDDLAQTLVIQPDGTFNFPLIGRVQAEGLTPRELEQRLTQALGRGFVRAPQVSVTVHEYRSKTVFVVGEVARPGPYPLSGSMNIMEVLAKAGATGGVGAEVVIVRPQGEVTGPVLPEESSAAEILRVNLRDIQMGQLKKNIQLRPNDTIFVSAAAKVYVTGEVRNPGGFTFLPGITVRQAISMAGGLSPDGSSSRLQVVRTAGSRTTRSKIGIDELVQPGDTIVVRAKLF